MSRRGVEKALAAVAFAAAAACFGGGLTGRSGFWLAVVSLGLARSSRSRGTSQATAFLQRSLRSFVCAQITLATALVATAILARLTSGPLGPFPGGAFEGVPSEQPFEEGLAFKGDEAPRSRGFLRTIADPQQPGEVGTDAPHPDRAPRLADSFGMRIAIGKTSLRSRARRLSAKPRLGTHWAGGAALPPGPYLCNPPIPAF